jgi:hypothetical protein
VLLHSFEGEGGAVEGEALGRHDGGGAAAACRDYRVLNATAVRKFGLNSSVSTTFPCSVASQLAINPSISPSI